MTFHPGDFLRDHWQKQPLLIRGLWAAWSNPLEPDELAGLACEESVESRLIRQSDGALVMEHGPFAESRFGKLGDAPWTLLVNAVDHHVPDVSALIDTFRFIPNWRIDDVMVSYAVDQGGVGPHFDQYDVFLVQGLGRRKWQIGGLCDDTTELLPHDDLRLLAKFEPVQEWILEPGDVLYVPPGIAHNGVAIGDDCMTYSIGFRAPSRDELLAQWAEHLVEQAEGDHRYADPALTLQSNPGEITAQADRRSPAHGGSASTTPRPRTRISIGHRKNRSLPLIFGLWLRHRCLWCVTRQAGFPLCARAPGPCYCSLTAIPMPVRVRAPCSPNACARWMT
jgi:50S ribosomal protein L16 3-hydroxylase